ncbi:MAG: alpha/beta hydrolase [Archangium sp.]|nr:alpha/beta hydrolase [Archangium sp.]
MAVEFVETSMGRIAIRQSGQGPTVFMLHGTSGSSRSFQKQFDSTLAEHFRLVAIDFPGDGDSPHAANPEKAYTLKGYGESIVALAEALNAPDAVFVGWSQGGHSLLHAMRDLPKASGFMLFGTAPVATIAAYLKVMTQSPLLQVVLSDQATEDDVRKMTSLFVRPGAPVPELFAEDFLRSDPRSRGIMVADFAAGGLIDETNVLAELRQPLAIVHGKQELTFVKRDWLDTLQLPTLWRGAVQDIADAGHAPHWEAPEIFNRLLGEFASDCFARR